MTIPKRYELLYLLIFGALVLWFLDSFLIPLFTITPFSLQALIEHSQTHDLLYWIIVSACLALSAATLHRYVREEKLLRQSEERLRLVVDNSPDTVFQQDRELRYVWIGGVMEQGSFGEYMGKTDRELFPAEDAERLSVLKKPVLEEGISVRAEVRLGFQGETRWYDAFYSPWKNDGGAIVGLRGYVRDITERKRVEGNLYANEQKFRTLVEQSSDGIVISDGEGRVIVWNRAQEAITGYPRAAVEGKLVEDVGRMLLPEERIGDHPRYPQIVREFLKDPAASEGRILENEIRTAKGERRFIQKTIFPLTTDGGKRLIGSISRDMTGHRYVREETEATLALLRLVNSGNGPHEFIKTVTAFLRNWSGCEAVGIRLKDGEDFPYFETHGFPEEFVQKERFLCSRDGKGEIMRDAGGNPLFECVCGALMEGKIKPPQPYLTPFGSFWTNSTSKPRVVMPESDLPARGRGRCVEAGYESVALIPLKLGDERIGLLQFNDRRTDRFTPELVSFLERVSTNLAMGLANKRAQDALRESEDRYRTVVENTKAAIVLISPSFEVISANSAVRALFPDVDFSNNPVCYRTLWRPALDAPCRDCCVARTIEDGAVHEAIVEREMPARGKKHYRVTSSPVKDSSGDITAAIEIITDVTENAEYEERLRKLSSELVLVEDRERRRIATAVHDRVGQALAIAKMKLGEARRQAADTKLAAPLEELQRFIEEGIQHTRVLTFELSVPILYELGLEAAVEWLAENMTKRYRVAWDVQRPAGAAALDVEVRVILFNAVRELMMNTVKHAGVPAGRVRIESTDREIAVTVEDEGAGFVFDGKSAGDKFGLFNVRESVAFLGGRVDIRTAPGEGTRVTLRSPMKRRNASEERK